MSVVEPTAASGFLGGRTGVPGKNPIAGHRIGGRYLWCVHQSLLPESRNAALIFQHHHCQWPVYE